MPRGRCWNGEVENGDVYEKYTVSQYYGDQSYPVRPHLPHMGKGLVMQFALISVGYLIDGDNFVMHEGMVWRPTPDPGPSKD